MCSPKYVRLLTGLAAVLVTSLALAHHSGAMFDDKKVVTLTGTVRAFQWSNPHCWIELLVPADPGPVEWSVEMGSPSQLFRVGWRPQTLKPGSRITVVIHPMRDGTRGGLFISASAEDGKPIGAAPVQ